MTSIVVVASIICATIVAIGAIIAGSITYYNVTLEKAYIQGGYDQVTITDHIGPVWQKSK